MKMIYAGTAGVAEDYLYNCTRNIACEKLFYIPITALSDLQLYFDFPFGQPSSYTINLIDCNGNATPLTWCSYVIGQHLDDTWYGIFTAPEQVAPAGHFFISAEFGSNKYFSNQIKIDECNQLTEVTSCYNDTLNQQYAFDCNGVYYQYHAGTGSASGNPELRYYHKAFVRNGAIIESKNKLSFTLFNSRTAYKNSVSKEFLFQSEPVPRFYKDILLAVFNRGNILIDGVPYTLTESQDISVIDDSVPLWKMDIQLTEKCSQYFSCTPTICEPPECGSPVSECITVALVGTPVLPDGTVGVPYSYDVNFTGTAPVTVDIISIPSWMTATIVGSHVHYGGTPDSEGAGIEANIGLVNCGGEVTIDGFFTINPAAVDNINWVYANDVGISGNLTILVNGVTIVDTAVSGSGSFSAAISDVVSVLVNSTVAGIATIDISGPYTNSTSFVHVNTDGFTVVAGSYTIAAASEPEPAP